MIICCTFENSVINLIKTKQHVFFILVHSDFLGILLPDHVSYTNSKVNKKFHEPKRHATTTLTFGKNGRVGQYKQEE
jgi:hypothetical protein